MGGTLEGVEAIRLWTERVHPGLARGGERAHRHQTSEGGIELLVLVLLVVLLLSGVQ